ncbi:MAG: hypothetical protein U0Q15_02145 [Kineosporiaceae bacterium]
MTDHRTPGTALDDLAPTASWLSGALRADPLDRAVDTGALASGAVRTARRRHRTRLTASALAVGVAVLGAGAFGASALRGGHSSSAPAISPDDLDRWTMSSYEPEDPMSVGYLLPELRMPWPTSRSGVPQRAANLTPVAGMACGDDVRRVARPAALTWWQDDDGRRDAVLSGWGRGAGPRRFAEIVGGNGMCLWPGTPRPIARTAFAGDDGWAGEIADEAVGRPASVAGIAVERVGDLIVAVTVRGERGEPRGVVGLRAAGYADELVRQVRASGHPAAVGAMPVEDDDAPVRYVVPRPSRAADPGNPVPDVEPLTADLPPRLVLLSSEAPRSSDPRQMLSCVDAGGATRTVPDPRLGVRRWTYERAGAGIGVVLVQVDVGRWPSGEGAASFTPARGFGEPCSGGAPVVEPVPGWSGPEQVLVRGDARSATARVRVGDDVVVVAAMPASAEVTAADSAELARSVADAVTKRLQG